MKVGVTYDLRDDYLARGFKLEECAEFDSKFTIDSIVSELESLGYETERIGTAQSLVSMLAQGKRWDMVFNIAEGLYGTGREALVPALLDDYKIPYTFSDPAALCVSLDKALAKRVVRDAGVPTPDFAVARDADDLKQVSLPFPLFAKPLTEGTGKGIGPQSKINSSRELEEVGSRLLSLFQQPVLLEAFLPGREYTVGIVGTGKRARTVGIIEIFLGNQAEPDAYTYINKEQYETKVTYKPVRGQEARQALDVALAAYNVLGCRDAGRVDLREDAQGTPCFIEVNPLAGLNPVRSDLPILCSFFNMSYHDLMAAIMESAMERMPPAP